MCEISCLYLSRNWHTLFVLHLNHSPSLLTLSSSEFHLLKQFIVVISCRLPQTLWVSDKFAVLMVLVPHG